MFFEFRGYGRGNFLQKVSPCPFKNLFEEMMTDTVANEDMKKTDIRIRDIINKDIMICAVFSCSCRKCSNFSSMKQPSGQSSSR